MRKCGTCGKELISQNGELWCSPKCFQKNFLEVMKSMRSENATNKAYKKLFPELRYCELCGTEVSKGKRFCEKCIKEKCNTKKEYKDSYGKVTLDKPPIHINDYRKMRRVISKELTQTNGRLILVREIEILLNKAISCELGSLEEQTSIISKVMRLSEYLGRSN